MPTKLELMNNIYYDKPYNSEQFFELHYCQQFAHIPHEFPEGRRIDFYAKAENDYFMILTTSDATLETESTTFHLNIFDFLIWKPDGNQTIIHYPQDMSSFYIFIFSGTCCEEILTSLNLKINQIYNLTYNLNLPDFSKQIGYISHELNRIEEKKYNTYIASTMFLEFLGHLSRHRNDSHESDSFDAIKLSVKYINTYATKKLNINEIIKNSHLSRSTFYILFKEYTGMSILQYINDLKLSKAADYMTLLHYSATDAATVMGFDDPMYFGRIFKRKFKMTPTEYKKKHTTLNHLIQVNTNNKN